MNYDMMVVVFFESMRMTCFVPYRVYRVTKFIRSYDTFLVYIP